MVGLVPVPARGSDCRAATRHGGKKATISRVCNSAYFLCDAYKAAQNLDGYTMTATRQRQTGSRGMAGPEGDAAVSEAGLWEAADALRGGMDAAEYKHVVLGLVFLRYVSDAFEGARAKLTLVQGADPEDPDEYRAQNIFWVPQEGRWSHVKAQARQPTVGQIVDNAMAAIERENPAIRDVLPKNYAGPSLGKTRLGRIIDLIGNMRAGGAESGSRDVPGRVYGHLLSGFVGAGGKKGGQFHTPRSVARLLVEMLRPYGSVYDPCCGSAGMLVQSVELARAGGNGNGDRDTADTSVYGQESDYATWQLARMNLAIRGIDGGRIVHGDSLHDDRHPDLKADCILANPPFNASGWGGERLRDDRRWVHGTPPKGNANFAWVQHTVHHMAPSGAAGLVLDNGSMSSNRSGEGDIRKSLVEVNLVDCMVALPGQLFYSTHMPACLWLLSRDRASRRRGGEVLFVDARRMGRMLDGIRRELTGDDIDRIARTYRAWCGDQTTDGYADASGFCKSAKPDEVRKHGYVLAPDRYIGAEPEPDGGKPFKLKMSGLAAQWEEQQAEAKELDAKIRQNLRMLGLHGAKT